MKDIYDIIRDHLTDNGYDGLYNPGICCCSTKELFYCLETMEGVGSCLPGVFTKCSDCKSCEGYICGQMNEEGYCIGPKGEQ